MPRSTSDCRKPWQTLCKHTFVIKLLAESQALTIVPLGLLLRMQRGGHVAQALEADRHTAWITDLLTDPQALAKQQAGLGAQM